MSPYLTPITRRAMLHRTWAAAAVCLALAAGCSGGDAADADDAAEPSSSGGSSATSSANGLFDSSVVHEISVSFDQTEYDNMIAEFQSSGDKKWIRATATIDGSTFKEVGMRLKGNSSLMGLRNGGANAGGNANGARAGGIGGSASASTPNGLPWLIRLDKYIDGQNMKGTSEFVVRSNNSQTSLNEAVALEVLGLSGQVTQKAFSTSFRVNGSTEKLRLAVENPGDDWDDENFANDGVLYKAESGGDYSYRGDDAKAYEDIFDQETDTDHENFAPLTTFLKFINQSDDATFAKDLGTYLEIDAFAKYMAGQELVANFDDIDGPGNNSYLRYDAKTGRITIVSWDLNLAYGGLGGAGGGPGGAGGAFPGGGQFGGGALPSGATGALPAGANPFGGGAPPSGATGALPGGRGARPADGAFPGGAAASGATGAGAAGGNAAGGNAARAGGGFGGGRSNILVTRFLANDSFKAIYDKALATMKADVYGSGKATEVLNRWKALLTTQASDLVPAATIESEASSIAAYLKG